MRQFAKCHSDSFGKAPTEITMSKLVLCVFLALCTSFVQGGNEGQQDVCGGVMIGNLPTRAHDVNGTLFVEGEYDFCIQDFFYDGNGPDAFLYFYYPGDTVEDPDDVDETGGGVFIPLPGDRPQFQPGRAFNGEIFRFSLPEFKFRACDFEGFGIWCRYANQLFTYITWDNSNIFTPSTDPVPNMIQCTASPGRGYVGQLTSSVHDVGGQLYVRDDKTFVIRNFTYDGQAPDLFVYTYNIGVEVDPAGGGDIIPLTMNNSPDGGFDDTVYTGLPMPDLIITIPNDEDLFTCDIGTFTIWCRDVEVFFATIDIDIELFSNNPLEVAYEPNRLMCERPSTTPGVLIGELPTTDARAISGTFYVWDPTVFFIQLFSYDARARGENVFIYYFPIGVDATDNGEGGFVISMSEEQEGFIPDMANSYFNEDFRIDVRLADGEPINACDVGTISIIDLDVGETVTTIDIPSSAFSEEGSEDTIRCVPGTAGSPPAFSTLGLFGALAVSLLALLFKA